uniref:YqgF/RNase H-like domain-containing protein n=1 Tax=Parascaris univalens TaxID=6257 RepID=A0A915C740_PARUN
MLHSRPPQLAPLAFLNIGLSQCSRYLLIVLLVYRIGTTYKCLISAITRWPVVSKCARFRYDSDNRN